MILLLSIILSLATSPLEQVRALFFIANKDESANKMLLKLTKSSTAETNSTFYGYNAAGTILMANHTSWPNEKLSYFNQGKANLEKVIKEDPTNVELRYIRYNIQKNAPSFLGYTTNLKEDKSYIIKHIDQTNWPNEFKAKVKKSVK
jgi:hypothetical protein